MLVVEQDIRGQMNEADLMADGADPGGHGGEFDEMDRQDLCNALLESLVTMASKSKRRQADLSAALRRSGIGATSEQVRDALIELQSSGCIREIVPLYDGGMLVTVTNMGMDRTTRNPHWLFLEKLTPVPA